MNTALYKSFKCDRKREFRTIKSATNFLKHAKKAGILISDNLEIYECEFCGYYHLGHSKRKEN